MRRNDSWRVRLLLAGGSFILALAVAAVLGEVAIRYRERHRSTVPGTMPQLYYRHSRLRHALVRNYDYYGWMRVNPQGFRGSRPVALAKSPGTMRIMAVGGSTTFDSFVTSDSAAWPARLESWLKRLAPDRSFEVVNAGVPGYTMVDDLIRFAIELHAYRPDLIILYQGHNDLFASLRSARSPGSELVQRQGEARMVTPWIGWLERHSLLYGKLAERIQIRRFFRIRTNPSDSSNRSRPDGLSPAAQEFEKLVTMYLASAKALDIPVVIPEVVHISGSALTEADTSLRRMWQTTVPFATPETVLAGYEVFNQALERAGARHGAPYLSMESAALVGPRFYVPDDPIHFNDRGADRFAEELALQLVNTLPLKSSSGR